MYNHNDELLINKTTQNLLSNLKIKCKVIVSDFLHILKKHNEIIGLLWGGSISRDESDEYSDIDLFCLCKKDQNTSLVNKIIDSISKDNRVDRVVSQGIFQWLGQTITIYFKNEEFFSIDIGFIEYSNRNSFFWEPKGLIIWDNENIISKNQKKIQELSGYKKYPFFSSQPILHSILMIKKIKKNLLRGHLWNCNEYLNKLRRNLIFLLRIHIINAEDFLGNPERNIEDVFPEEIIIRLNDTQPQILHTDITRCTLLIIDWLLEIINSDIVKQETIDSKMIEWYFVELNNSLNFLGKENM